MRQNIDKLTNQLLHEASDPISILECRSGWRVFIQTGWDGEEAIGKNVAYSSECNNSFSKMIQKAIKILKEMKKEEQILSKNW